MKMPEMKMPETKMPEMKIMVRVVRHDSALADSKR
jgi:hypothetical protein